MITESKIEICPNCSHILELTANADSTINQLVKKHNELINIVKNDNKQIFDTLHEILKTQKILLTSFKFLLEKDDQ